MNDGVVWNACIVHGVHLPLPRGVARYTLRSLTRPSPIPKHTQVRADRAKIMAHLPPRPQYAAPNLAIPQLGHQEKLQQQQ